MTFNKKIAKTLVFALGFGAISLLGVNSAKAASPAQGPTAVVDTHIKFDGDKAYITVADESKATLWGVAKELKNEKGANFVKIDTNSRTYYKISEVEPISDKIVDVSPYFGKKLTLAFGTVNNLEPVNDTSKANAAWTILEINPADKSFTIGYVSKTGEKFGKLDATEKGKAITGTEAFGGIVAYKIAAESKAVEAVDLKTDEAKYEVKIGDGLWMAIKKGTAAPADKVYLLEDFADDKVDLKLQMFTQNGSTLYFRTKADNTAKKWTWAGDAKKVSFKKQPNAPKIVLDSTKDSSNIKSGMTVSLNKDNSGTTEDSITLPDGTKKATFKDLKLETIVASKTGLLKVFNEASKGKIKSKETILTLVRPADITVVTPIDEQGKDIITNKLTLKLKVPYDVSKGAELINKDKETAYEYYVEHTANANEGKIKWSKLKAPKSETKPTKAALKFSTDAKAFTFGANSKLYVRKAGEKQVGNFMNLPSLTKEITLTLTNKAQSITATKGADVKTADFAADTGTIEIENIQKNKDKVYKVELEMTGRHKVKSPKIKVTTKVPGVSIKVGKFNSSNKATLEIKISKKTFSGENAGAQIVEFTYSAESLKDKPVKVTLTPAAG